MNFPVANRQPVSLRHEAAGAFTTSARSVGSWRRADACQMARASRSVSGGLVGNSGSGDTFGRESGWTTTAQRQVSRDRPAIRCAALRLITLVMLKAGSNPATSILLAGLLSREGILPAVQVRFTAGRGENEAALLKRCTSCTPSGEQ